MIKTVKLERFRCYLETTFTLKEITVLVGKNNAGKSTIVEALRLISLIANRYRTSNYVKAPAELGLKEHVYGIVPSIHSLPFDLGEGVIYYYKQPPATITVSFTSGEVFKIFIMLDRIFAVIIDRHKNIITNKADAIRMNPISVKILPQIRPLLKVEKQINPDTIRESMDSYLTYRHFRNELFYYRDQFFETFKQNAELSWPGLEVDEILQLKQDDDKGLEIQLRIKDNRFPAEVGQVGSGLQLWLQVIWFLCHSSSESCVILDEPDVYMHPDLQKKLLDMVTGKYQQVVIATHSVEIMGSVDPKSILFVDKNKQVLLYATDITAVQRIVDNIGGIYNLQLVRLGQSKKCIFVEGEDMEYLKLFYMKLFPENILAFELIPNMDIKGFANYKDAIGSAAAFRNMANEAIQTYCILDRDFYLDDKIELMKSEASESGLNLHIWNMKELENYLIIPETIYRLILKKNQQVLWNDFYTVFCGLVEGYYDLLYREYTTSINNENRKLVAGSAMELAAKYLKQKWTTLSNKIAILPGKKFLAELKGCIKNQYGVQISEKAIIYEMNKNEIRPEIIEVLSAINLTKSFEQYALCDEA